MTEFLIVILIGMVPGQVLRFRDCFCVRMGFDTLQPVKRLDLEPHRGGFRAKAVGSCKTGHMTAVDQARGFSSERCRVDDREKSICDFMRHRDQKKQVGQVVALSSSCTFCFV